MKVRKKKTNATANITITEQLRVKCFCGAWVTAGHHGRYREPCLVHPVPACQRYLESEPTDFLRALRKWYVP